jgi:hypothetical protein
MLVAIDKNGAAPSWNVNGDDLSLERAGVLRGDGSLM